MTSLLLLNRQHYEQTENDGFGFIALIFIICIALCIVCRSRK